MSRPKIIGIDSFDKLKLFNESNGKGYTIDPCTNKVTFYGKCSNVTINHAKSIANNSHSRNNDNIRLRLLQKLADNQGKKILIPTSSNK